MTRITVPTCKHPDDPSKMYIRIMYKTCFFGPFDSEESLIGAIRQLDQEDPYWCYDSFCVIYGANPLPEDYVLGFQSVSPEIRSRIKNRFRNKD